MNRAKVNEYEYINFLIGTQQAYSCVEAERVQPESENPSAHDAINRPLSEVEMAATGTIVHLKSYGMVKVFQIVATNGDIEVNALPEVSSGKHGVDFDYWATNALNLDELQRLQWSEFAWTVEAYHRGLKPCCGVERAQVRASRAQRNHVGFAIRAFLRLELHMCATRRALVRS